MEGPEFSHDREGSGTGHEATVYPGSNAVVVTAAEHTGAARHAAARQIEDPLCDGYSVRSYLNGTEDIALPPGEWGWHPRMSSRLGLYRLVQMPGSHELIFSNPTGLADKIIEAGRD